MSSHGDDRPVLEAEALQRRQIAISFNAGGFSRKSGQGRAWDAGHVGLHTAVQVRGDSACFAASAKDLGADTSIVHFCVVSIAKTICDFEGPSGLSTRWLMQMVK